MTAPEVTHAKAELHEIATHAYKLAMGLQNIAPPQTSPGGSIQYLKEISLVLEKISHQIAELSN